jgi:cytochrome c oxidase subunit 3
MDTTAHAEGHMQASYGETEELIHRRQRMGVLLFLAADAVFVACLLFSYFYLRGLNTENGWLPAGTPVADHLTSWLIAGLVVLSAVTYELARRAGDRGSQGALRGGLAVALVLVVADLVIQFLQLANQSFTPTSGAYSSCFLVMAGYHAFHLVVLFLLGLGLFLRAMRGMYVEPDGRNQLDLMGLVWWWAAISAVLFAITLLFTGSPRL